MSSVGLARAASIENARLSGVALRQVVEIGVPVYVGSAAFRLTAGIMPSWQLIIGRK